MLLQSRVTMKGDLLDSSESMIDVGIQVSLKYETLVVVSVDTILERDGFAAALSFSSS
jgi:hypothetical protein